MNLHGIASGIVSAVNPMVNARMQVSTGYATAIDGHRVPSYAPTRVVRAQIQSLTSGDLMQLSGLNLNGEKRAIYLTGNLDGVSRPDNKGGDLVTFPDGSIWLVVSILENWYMSNGWMKVAVTRQNKS